MCCSNDTTKQSLGKTMDMAWLIILLNALYLINQLTS